MERFDLLQGPPFQERETEAQAPYINRLNTAGEAIRAARHTPVENGGSRMPSFNTGDAALKEQRMKILTALSRTQVLVIGLGISTGWTAYRAVRYGAIVCCKYSLAALIWKIEDDELSRKDENALDGLRWTFLWWISVVVVTEGKDIDVMLK